MKLLEATFAIFSISSLVSIDSSLKTLSAVTCCLFCIAGSASAVSSEGREQVRGYYPPDDGVYNTTSAVIEQEDVINVHLVQHTHDDTGWLLTVDQYFNQTVEDIISSVVQSLLKNRDRKFIYAEVAFFTRWFRLQVSFLALLLLPAVSISFCSRMMK